MSGGEHFLKEMSTIRAKTRATTTTTTTKKAGRIFTHFLLRKKLLDFTFHGRVPMVLDSIIGSPRKELGNLRPAVSQAFVCVEDDAVLFFCPRLFPNVGVEVVVPPAKAPVHRWKLERMLVRDNSARLAQ
jgi:hypothetical protein|tara:strand:+ start:286 stop:675 length:390 start_codon:yes stop_codon:yes gene_type:complete